MTDNTECQYVRARRAELTRLLAEPLVERHRDLATMFASGPLTLYIPGSPGVRVTVTATVDEEVRA